MGGKHPYIIIIVPAITFRSYTSHNNIAFCRPCLSSFIAPRPLAIQSNTLKDAAD